MKNIFLGLIIGIILTISSSVIANSNNIENAYWANFNFLVNGNNVEVKTKPIAINGSSYLPVRELSNLLGYDVDYNNETRTIILNNPKVIEGESSNPIENSKDEEDIKILNSNIYLRNQLLSINAQNSLIEYNGRIYTTAVGIAMILEIPSRDVLFDSEIQTLTYIKNQHELIASPENISLNKKEIDTNGTIHHSGITYLPIKVIAEAFELDFEKRTDGIYLK